MTARPYPSSRGLQLLAVIILIGAAPSRGQQIVVKPEHDLGVYRAGQVIRWNIELKGVEASETSYQLKKGGLTELSRGKVDLSDGKGQIEATLSEPGWLLVEVTLPAAEGKAPLKALGGALVSPERIKPALGRPDDFDDFWQSKLRELAAVPANPRLTPGESGKADITYHRIAMDNIRGSHIQGQLARPSQADKLPAMLIVQWAGVYPLQKNWVIDRAAEGWLVLNINAHDLPIDEPDTFYKDQSAGPLEDYPRIGNDDRETSYFLRMYLSCFRGAQYLAERPDWDGRTLVVTGGSQGGLQSLVTAALHPKVTAVLACVPAGCDLNGPEAGRLPGWPMWYWNTKGKDEAKVRSAARYYDVVNFASRVKCPVLVGAGLIDTTCPPPGVIAACNLLAGPREVVVLPLAEHGDKNGSHGPYYARFNAWTKALLKGDPPPVQASRPGNS
ncbi:MAG: acetylxylan esterase [Solirubrobacterales bacterium]|nr:acetylxylan esterase [Solirubrobacterales bacterium]